MLSGLVLRKSIQIGACVLAVAIQAALCWAECVEVQRQPAVPLESSAVVRLAVVDKGKPAAGAKLEFYLLDSGRRPEEPTLTLVSDEFGWIKSPTLADGRYEVVASTEDNLRADLALDVSSHYGRTPSAFKMELFPADPQDVDPEKATLEKVPITNHLEVFRGTVTDQSGAVIPGAKIRIYRRGTGDEKVLQTLKAGKCAASCEKAGQFETKLDPGTYVAEFLYQGFAPKLVGFEIVSSGSRQIDVVLELGHC